MSPARLAVVDPFDSATVAAWFPNTCSFKT
jgi:hypothetical protein